MAIASIEIIADSSQVRTATRDLQELAKQGSGVQKSSKGIETSLSGVGAAARNSSTQIDTAKRSVGSFGSVAQNAGYQVQDFAVQVAGGQSAFMAFAQQAPQFLGAFGAGGAVAGALVSIGAIIGGVAYSALNGAQDVKTLSDAVEQLGDAVVITDDGVALLTAEIVELAKVSQAAAMAQLAQEIIDAKNVIKMASGEVKAAFKALDGMPLSVLTTQLDRYKAAMEEGGNVAAIAFNTVNLGVGVNSRVGKSFGALEQSVRDVSKEFGLSKEQSLEFLQSVADASRSADGSGLQNLQTLISGLNKETGFTNEKLSSFQNVLSEAFSEGRNAAEIIQVATGFLSDFEGALTNSTGSAAQLADRTKRLTEQLTIQQMELKGAGLQAALYAAALATGKASADELDPALRALVVENYNLTEAQKASTQATRDQAQAERELAQEMRQELSEIKAKAAESKRSAEEADRIRQRATSGFESVQSGLAAENNPAEQARQQLQARLDVIREYAAIEGSDKAAAMDAQLAAEEAYQQELTAITAQEAQQRRALTQDQLSAASSFLGTFAELAREGGEKSFQSYKRLAQAQAAIAGAQAIIRALAEGGPFFGPVLAAGIGALTAVQIAKINQQQYVGRATGGQVIGDRSYLVGERGPELFTPNSSGNGRITPFSQLMQQTQSSGNNAPIINITNVGGGEATVTNQRFSETDRRWVIDVVAGDMQRRGKVHKSITSTTDATNRTI